MDGNRVSEVFQFMITACVCVETACNMFLYQNYKCMIVITIIIIVINNHIYNQ